MSVFKSIYIIAFLIFLSACGSTEKTASLDKSVTFSAKETDQSYELTCKPLNKVVAKDATWVKKCNAAAYDFLNSKIENGVKFKKEIDSDPFGQAAVFMATMLQNNPKNFRAVSVQQTYTFISNRT